jgi:hypothetical protein
LPPGVAHTSFLVLGTLFWLPILDSPSLHARLGQLRRAVFVFTYRRLDEERPAVARRTALTTSSARYGKTKSARS